LYKHAVRGLKIRVKTYQALGEKKVNPQVLDGRVMRYRKIPDETVKRLPLYLRRAIHLSEGKVKCVLSKELASLLGVTSC
jgi:hypothetical protein